MEPTYHFEKGKGWVLGPACPSIEVTIEGKRYLIEDRPPNKGERYRCANKFNPIYVNPDGSSNLKAWAISQTHSLAPWGFYAGRTIGEGNVYVTLVPL